MKRPRSLAASAVPFGLLALSIAACGNILGLKDLGPYPDEGGLEAGTDGSDESSADATGPHNDSSTPAGDGSGADGTAGDSSLLADAVDDRGGDGPARGDSSGSDAPEDSTPPIDSPVSLPDAPAPDASTGDAPCVGGQTDAHNCGMCGHDCRGGSCVGGACQPFVLSTNVTAYDIVSVGGSLYWVDEGSSVWTCTIASCSPHTIATGQSTPERIAYGGNGVLYWTNYGTGTAADGSVEAYQISNSMKTTVASSRWTPQGIAADGTFVIWAETAAPTPQIVRFTISGSAVMALSTGTSSAPTGVAIGGSSVYFTDQGTGNVESSLEATLAQSPVATGQSSPWALSVDGTYVYWVDFTATGAVWQYTLAGGALHQLASSQAYPMRVASDAAKVYWVDQGASTTDGSFVGCDPASCNTPTTIANALAKPSSLAMDSTGVYFGTVGDQKLYMMVR